MPCLPLDLVGRLSLGSVWVADRSIWLLEVNSYSMTLYWIHTSYGEGGRRLSVLRPLRQWGRWQARRLVHDLRLRCIGFSHGDGTCFPMRSECGCFAGLD